MTRLSRLTQVVAGTAILLLILPIVAQAGSDKREHPSSDQVRTPQGHHSDDDDEYEEEQDGEHGAAQTWAAPPITATLPAVIPAQVPTPALTPAPAATPALTTALSAAVKNLAADPGNAGVQEVLRGLVATGGPATPSLWVDGRPLTASVLSDQNGASVPLRPVVEALGARLSVEAATGAITVALGGRQAELVRGRAFVTLGGRAVAVDSAPFQLGNITYVSLRTLAELTAAQVIYDPNTGLVMVSAMPPGH